MAISNDSEQELSMTRFKHCHQKERVYTIYRRFERISNQTLEEEKIFIDIIMPDKINTSQFMQIIFADHAQFL
jgi:hypothetical protein